MKLCSLLALTLAFAVTFLASCYVRLLVFKEYSSARSFALTLAGLGTSVDMGPHATFTGETLALLPELALLLFLLVR